MHTSPQSAPPRRVAIAVDMGLPFPNHHDVYQGVSTYAHEQGNWTIAIDEHPTHRQRQRAKIRGVYDGVIARADADMQRRCKNQKIPLVNVMMHSMRSGQPGVYNDAYQGGRLAAEHLLARGFRRFALLADLHFLASKEGVRGVTDLIDASGHVWTITEYRAGDIGEPAYWVELEEAMYRWISSMTFPAAAFIDSPLLARLVAEICPQLKVSVPHDLAIICSRNVELMLNIPTQVSAVKEDYGRVGYEAARLLDSLMNNEDPAQTQIMVPPTGIVARTSTDHFAVQDELVAEALRCISDNIQEKLTVDDIAYRLAVSPSTLHRRFEAALGRGVAAEVRRLRISTAKVLLSEKHLSMTAVSTQAGFSSTDVMAQVFRRELGLTPYAYRKKLHQTPRDV